MREIKFRAWDKITKKYFYSGTLDNGDVLVIHLDGEIEISSDDTYKPEDFIIEQFTGLRDKNGREIYEGDILSMENQPHRTGVVEFSGNGYWIKEEFANYIPAESMCEIIGNIHENLELLKSEGG